MTKKEKRQKITKVLLTRDKLLTQLFESQDAEKRDTNNIEKLKLEIEKTEVEISNLLGVPWRDIDQIQLALDYV